MSEKPIPHSNLKVERVNWQHNQTVMLFASRKLMEIIFQIITHWSICIICHPNAFEKVINILLLHIQFTWNPLLILGWKHQMFNSEYKETFTYWIAQHSGTSYSQKSDGQNIPLATHTQLLQKKMSLIVQRWICPFISALLNAAWFQWLRDMGCGKNV